MQTHLTPHTPGPWTVEEGVHGTRILSDEELVAESVCHAADAHLIAAAPELLEAAKEALSNLLRQGQAEAGFVQDLEVALAKAEGR